MMANRITSEKTSCNNIGKPIGCNSIYILDEDLHPVPLGVCGELCVSGPQLARGYLNRPDLTAQAFEKSTLCSGERLYRTGDLARFNADGSVELIGRKDNQIKLHGLRIELDEIEHALYEHSEVKRACVLPLLSNTTQMSLVAFLTFNGMGDNETALEVPLGSQAILAASYIDDLQNDIRNTLPSYMIPNVWLPLNRIPVNSSGKIDRNQLSTLYSSLSLGHLLSVSSTTNEDDDKTLSPLERSIRNIWSETLNLSSSKISIDHSFYQLGGDSISAIRVSSLSRQIGIALSVREIMQNSTIRSQALVATVLETGSLKSLQVNQEYGHLTPIMAYFLETAQKNIHHYNQSWLLKLKNPITSKRLAQTIPALLQHHELLRSRFTCSENQWNMKILAVEEAEFYVHHRRIESLDELKDNVHHLQRSLNIHSGPIFQVSLYDLYDGQQLLFMTAHHFVIDLVSWRILWEDLERLLEGKECSYKSMSFVQWSAMLDEYSQTLDMDMWPSQQVIAPLVNDPSLLEQNTIDTAKYLSFSLPRSQTELLFDQSNFPFQTEPTDLMIASLVIAYCSAFDEKSMAIGIEGHGREPWSEEIDISRTVGWFTTIHPIIVEASFTEDPLTILKRVKDLRKLIPGNGLIYGLLRHLSRNTENSLSQDNIQISFNYAGRFQQLENENSFFQPVKAPFDFDKCNMSGEWKRNHVFDITAAVRKNCFQAGITYNSALHSEDIVSQWLTKWQETLSSMIDLCAQLDVVQHTRSDFPLLKLSESQFNLLYTEILPEIGVDNNLIDDILPCTHLQEGLIVGLLRDSENYHVQQQFDLVGECDIAKFQSAWQTVIQSHPILHSIFVQNSIMDNSNSTFFQVVVKDYTPQWTYMKCTEASVEEITSTYLANDKARRFELGQPNMRFALIEIDCNKHRYITSWHHAILDASAWKLVLEDFNAVYHQQTRPKTYPFKDFVSELQNRTPAFIEEEKAHWQNRFAQTNVEAFPKLLLSKESESATVRITGRMDISSTALLQFAQHSQVTSFTLVKAAWALLLRMYTQSEDVAFGFIVNGRSSELEGDAAIIGPCINTLPCRIIYEGNSTIGEWLQGVHKDYNSSLSYQQSSLRDIQSWTGGISLFDTLINYKLNYNQQSRDIDMAKETSNMKKLELVLLTGKEATEYPLSLNIYADKHNVSFSLDVKKYLVSEYYAEQITNDFTTILEGLVSATLEERLDDLYCKLSKSYTPETTTVTDSSSDLDSNTKSYLYLHMMFEQVAVLYPNNIAIQFETSEYVTYAELNQRANQLAHYLINLGVGPESMVPLCLDKSVFMIVAILAVLKAGGAYVPLDPNNPSARNDFIIKETNAQMVITIAQYKQMFNEVALLLMDEDMESIECSPTNNPVVNEHTESNLCYVLYTSGSTGTPKGVMIEHYAVVNLLFGLQGTWNLTTQDVALQFANYTFDASVLEIFPALTSGARLALAEKDNLLTDLEHCIRMMDVTSMFLTVTTISNILPQNIPSVTKVMVGAEMITTILLKTWAHMVTLHNVYGPTEAAVMFMANPIVSEEISCSNIGKPIGCNSIYILDEDMHPVPLGVCGELCVSGPQLARGYLNRPDLTAQAFEKSTVCSGERLYRTGDLARFNADGSVELIGRKDNQIKLNGLRIELDEIEHALYEHSEVKRACVLPLASNTSRMSLVGFLTFNNMDDNETTVEVLSGSNLLFTTSYIDELQNIMRKRLPSYMIPNIWLPLNRIPVNSSGKIDRKHLSTLYSSLSLEELLSVSGTTNEYDGTTLTAVEKCIRNIWSEVLNVPPNRIAINDSFYQLGGDSISAIRVSSLSRQIGISLSVKEIIQNSTVRLQASVATVLETGSIESLQVGHEDFRLTPIMAYFLETSQNNIHHFNQSWLLKLKNPITNKQLAQTIPALLQHHELLRSRFTYSENQWNMKILSVDEAKFDVHHQRIESLDELKDNVHHLQRSLNIHSGPIFQVSLYDLYDGQQLLFMTAHHFVIDLVSWRILWEDLEQLLEGKECSYKSMSFVQWSVMLDDYSQTLDMDMWPSQQVIAPLVNDPSLLEQNTIDTAKYLSFSLPRSQTELLFDQSNFPFQTEPTDLMIASLVIAYCSAFDERSMAIGIEGHGREPWSDEIDISRTVGWFTVIHPIIVEASFTEDPLTILKRVKDLRKRIPRNGFIYGLLRHLSRNTENSLSQDNIQISFNYAGRFQQLENENSFFQPVKAPFNFDKCNLNGDFKRIHVFDITAALRENCFQGGITYSSALHSEDVVSRWLHIWQETLSTMITRCAQFDVVEDSRSDLSLLKLEPHARITEYIQPESIADC
ncbi:hypothetical protein K7432_005517 [Basidiobolus ranarum]|uniref:Carrier domain-containing protein n=1 Tax=Basidiobolus ranarum TaxID=34480 RepID=A0ABR2WWC7_9FUNG